MSAGSSWADIGDDDEEHEVDDHHEPAPAPVKAFKSAWGAAKHTAKATSLAQAQAEEEAQENQGGREERTRSTRRAQEPSHDQRNGDGAGGAGRGGGGGGGGGRGRGDSYDSRGGDREGRGYGGDAPARRGGYGGGYGGDRERGGGYGDRGGGGGDRGGYGDRDRGGGRGGYGGGGGGDRGGSDRYGGGDRGDRGGERGGYGEERGGGRYGGGRGGGGYGNDRDGGGSYGGRGGGYGGDRDGGGSYRGGRGGGGDRGFDRGDRVGYDRDRKYGEGRGFAPPDPEPRTEEELKALDARCPTKGPFTAFVGNLPFAGCERELQQFLEEVVEADVQEIRLITRDGRFKNFGYVTFKSLDSLKAALRLHGEAALRLHGEEFKGKKLKVDVAESRGDTRDRGENGRYGSGPAEGGAWRRERRASDSNDNKEKTTEKEDQPEVPKERRKLNLQKPVKKGLDYVTSEAALAPRRDGDENPFGNARPRELVQAEREARKQQEKQQEKSDDSSEPAGKSDAGTDRPQRQDRDRSDRSGGARRGRRPSDNREHNPRRSERDAGDRPQGNWGDRDGGSRPERGDREISGRGARGGSTWGRGGGYNRERTNSGRGEKGERSNWGRGGRGGRGGASGRRSSGHQGSESQGTNSQSDAHRTSKGSGKAIPNKEDEGVTKTANAFSALALDDEDDDEYRDVKNSDTHTILCTQYSRGFQSVQSVLGYYSFEV
eukprot:g225.t1